MSYRINESATSVSQYVYNDVEFLITSKGVIVKVTVSVTEGND